jgi:streptogramin lyase
MRSGLLAACGAGATPIPTAPAGPTQAAAAPLDGLALEATISGFDGASNVIATDDAVWALDHSNADVLRIDPTTNKVTATLDLGDGFASGLGLAGSKVWTFHQTAGEVVGIDPATAKVATTVKAGTDGDMFFVGEDAAWLISGGSLVRVDPATGEPTSLALDPACQIGAAAAGGGFVWLASGNGTLCKVDPRTGKVVAHGDTLGNGVGLGIVGGKPWLAGNDNGVAIVDPTKLTVETSVPPPAPGTFEGATYSLGSAGDNTVLTSDATGAGGWVRYTGATLGRVGLGSTPAITLYAGFPADLLPGGVVEAFGSLWVANFGAGTVTRHKLPAS